MNYHIKAWPKCVPIREWARFRCPFPRFLLFSWFVLCPVGSSADEVGNQQPHDYQQYLKFSLEELYRQGHALLAEGRLDDAMTCFTMAGNRYRPDMSREQKRLCAYAMNNAGGIAQARFSNIAAFTCFKRAMQMSEEAIHQTYNNIAGIYLLYDDFQNARQYLNMAFDVSLEQHDWRPLSSTLLNLLMLNWCVDSIGLSDGPIRRYELAEGIPHDSLYEATMRLARGVLAASRHDYDEAIAWLMPSASSADGVGAQSDASLSEYLYVARICRQQGRLQQAIDYLRQAEQKALRRGASDILLRVYKELTDYYAQTGNLEGQHQAGFQYMNLRDSINTAEEFGKIKHIEFLAEVERYEQQVNQLSQAKNTSSLIAICCGVALVLVLLLLLSVVRQNRRLVGEWQSASTPLPSPPAAGALPDSPHAELKVTAAALAAASPNSQEMRQVLQERIFEKMDDVDFISQSDLTVERLAQAIGVHERYVSQFINEQMNKNFNTLLNEYRIREICKRLTDFEHYGTLTNETIAEGLGYKSRSHFTRTFKKITGLTPTQYQRKAKQEKN